MQNIKNHHNHHGKREQIMSFDCSHGEQEGLASIKQNIEDKKNRFFFFFFLGGRDAGVANTEKDVTQTPIFLILSLVITILVSRDSINAVSSSSLRAETHNATKKSAVRPWISHISEVGNGGSVTHEEHRLKFNSQERSLHAD